MLCRVGYDPGVFGWLRRKKTERPAGDGGVVATQAAMEAFGWPKGAVITAVEETVLALPVGLFDDDRPIGEFLFGPEDMELNVPPEGEMFFVRLKPGMSVSLAKSCECYIVAEKGKICRLKVRVPEGGK